MAAVSRSRRRWFALSAASFAALAVMALSINTLSLTEWDRAVWAWFDIHQRPGWHVDADGAFSYLGRPLHVASAGVVCGALLSWRSRTVAPALLVIGGVAAGVIAEQVLKAAIHRVADISATYPMVYHHSFPSGHVTGAATLLGMVAVCLGAGRHGAVRAGLAVAVAAGVLTVALLALYSAAHTCTDVIGGMLLGGGIVALGAALVPSAERGAAAESG